METGQFDDAENMEQWTCILFLSGKTFTVQQIVEAQINILVRVIWCSPFMLQLLILIPAWFNSL